MEGPPVEEARSVEGRRPSGRRGVHVCGLGSRLGDRLAVLDHPPDVHVDGHGDGVSGFPRRIAATDRAAGQIGHAGTVRPVGPPFERGVPFPATAL